MSNNNPEPSPVFPSKPTPPLCAMLERASIDFSTIFLEGIPFLLQINP